MYLHTCKSNKSENMQFKQNIVYCKKKEQFQLHAKFFICFYKIKGSNSMHFQYFSNLGLFQ